MEGVDLEIRPAALKAIARKAIARKTGARGAALHPGAIPDRHHVRPAQRFQRGKVVVDEATIEENKAPLLLYREAVQDSLRLRQFEPLRRPLAPCAPDSGVAGLKKRCPWTIMPWTYLRNAHVWTYALPATPLDLPLLPLRDVVVFPIW